MISKSLFCFLFGIIILSVFSFSQVSFADLTFSDKFGSVGDDNDEFDEPTDLAISNDGKKLYVVDSENNRIKIYDLTGGNNCPSGTDEVVNDEVCFDDDFGVAGSSDGKFDIPTDLAIDKGNGDIYVVDSDNNRVQRFQSNGNYDNLEFGSSDNDDDEYLGTPSAIAVHKKTDYIYVADSTADSISVFDDDGDFLFSFDDDDSNDEFDEPAGLVIDDSEDILYVADTGNNRIRMFELTDGDNCPSGTDEVVNDEVCFVDDFGSSGSGDGKFDEPAGLAFDEDENMLYVADTKNNRIQVFEIIAGSTCPNGTDEIIDGVCFVEEFGSSGSGDGKFNAPSGLALDEDNGLLYVADTDNNRIQMLTIPTSDGSSSSSSSKDVPDAPKNLSATTASPSSIVITWDTPDPDDNDPKITGYKIEAKEGSGSYETIVTDTKSTATSFLHTGLDDDETYRYRAYAINSEGTSSVSSTSSAKPGHTKTPAGLTAVPISKNQILLSWLPPSETFGQSINGYDIKREVIEGVYDSIGSVNAGTTTFIVSNLSTDKTYTYVVSANIEFGSTNESPSASATPRKDSTNVVADPITSTAVQITKSSPPIKLTASVVSSTQINLTWSPPAEDGNSAITGYKIEVKRDNNPYTTLVADTGITVRTYSHTSLITNSMYTYKISAINIVGTSDPSNEFSATPKSTNVQISPLGKLTIDEGKLLLFTVKLLDNSVKEAVFSLDNNPPAGAKIISNTGVFSWTPTSSDGGKTYTLDVVAQKDGITDSETITIIVNDVTTTQPEPQPKELGIASFVDEAKDPQSYVDRYNNEEIYKKWFDDNFSEYDSIYQAVGLEEPKVKEKKFGICGPGTKLIDGVCTIVEKPVVKPWWQFW